MLHGTAVDARRWGQDQGRAQAAVIAEMAVAPALAEADLADGLTTGQRDRLQRATDLAIYNDSVLRLRVRGFNGQVVFSDDGTTAGGISINDPAFRSAAAGHTEVGLLSVPEAPGGQVIRVLQPIVASASGQSVGVLELYLPYEHIAARLREQTAVTYWRLGAGLGLLYLVLGLISWSTTRSLRRYAQRQAHEALHDALTGLPNRAAFHERARAALAQDGEPGAIVLVDLDRFKEVNDTLGHHAGDELLAVVADRLRAGLRPADTLARLGGDEFALILPRSDAATVRRLLDGLSAALATEVVLDGVPLSIEASFGVAHYPEHGRAVDELLRRADAAMYHGKRGSADIVVYAGEDMSHPTQWLVVQAELRHALARDELVLHYQPKVDLRTGEVVGVEALVRWQHPQRGLLPPSEFLPAAEQSGLIEPLTAWVLARALADQAAWTATGRSWGVSVNVSARNLEKPGFADFVSGLLAEHGTPAHRLLLEITETALAADTRRAEQAVLDLTTRGIGISVDDFGTGYTSMSQLRGLPIAEIKIDRTFVRDVLEAPPSQAIVRAIIALAHGLGSRVTAEGIESPEVADWLRRAGCDEAQGYLYSRPVPWAEVGTYEITGAAS
ncbi:EAL domain-containing protein [Actinoplanes sp. LDG1-01]|uniref:EAL domain-containing protein n=2 Tax=Paractinoplanes lichenicola TaxID=2802976 RepID=A0ABS1VSB9_9ACTN|nr:EAL domain-containing protein [Actinoplanes lichenicola]